MKFISLFAGIGGFDLGFERAGFECVAQVEIDPFCQKVLAKHWPNAQRFEDVKEFGKHNAPSADLICGGFPCQPHSLAGKRKGSSDDRDLWPEYFRIVRELKPAWVVSENVPGIRTTILDQVLSDLESQNYSTVTLNIPAIAFNAPHRRYRIFVVAYNDGFARRIPEITRQQEEAVLTDRDGASQFMADSCGQGLEKPGLRKELSRTKKKTSKSLERRSSLGEKFGENWWEFEPRVGRVANGVPKRVDRLRSLGNAITPQVAEFIARLLLQADTPNDTCTQLVPGSQ